jgi:hypothetical protein
LTFWERIRIKRKQEKQADPNTLSAWKKIARVDNICRGASSRRSA